MNKASDFRRLGNPLSQATERPASGPANGVMAEGATLVDAEQSIKKLSSDADVAEIMAAWHLEHGFAAAAAAYTASALNLRSAAVICQAALVEELRGRGLVKPPERPQVVCLCGSTRFVDTFNRINRELTLEGRIVLSIGCHRESDEALFANLPTEEAAAIKERLDALHLRKIDLADECLVLNIGGYIGASTRREIQHAEAMGKIVRYLEPLSPSTTHG